MSNPDAFEEAAARSLAGGTERHREKALEQGRLPVRERVALLLVDALAHLGREIQVQAVLIERT